MFSFGWFLIAVGLVCILVNIWDMLKKTRWTENGMWLPAVIGTILSILGGLIVNAGVTHVSNVAAN